jgi:hypothetical protein
MCVHAHTFCVHTCYMQASMQHACVASIRVHPYEFPSIQPRRSNLYVYASRHEVTKVSVSRGPGI